MLDERCTAGSSKILKCFRRSFRAMQINLSWKIQFFFIQICNRYWYWYSIIILEV